MNSAIRWYGGKGRIYDKIIQLMPPCKVYVEVFGGGASVLLNRKPVDLEVYNDIDKNLYNFFMVLSDPQKFKDFHRRVQPLLYSKDLYEKCRDSFEEEIDPVMKASAFFVAARQAFSGVLKSGWGYETKTKNKNVMSWMNMIDGLPEIHARLRLVQVQNMDWSRIFETYDQLDALFYCDPPYVHSTRVDGQVYLNEMSDDDHIRFIDKLLVIKGMAVVSGYQNDIYKKLEDNGWVRHDFDVACTPSKTIMKKRNRRIESVWVKPHRSRVRTFC